MARRTLAARGGSGGACPPPPSLSLSPAGGAGVPQRPCQQNAVVPAEQRRGNVRAWSVCARVSCGHTQPTGRGDWPGRAQVRALVNSRSPVAWQVLGDGSPVRLSPGPASPTGGLLRSCGLGGGGGGGKPAGDGGGRPTLCPPGAAAFPPQGPALVRRHSPHGSSGPRLRVASCVAMSQVRPWERLLDKCVSLQAQAHSAPAPPRPPRRIYLHPLLL